MEDLEDDDEDLTWELDAADPTATFSAIVEDNTDPIRVHKDNPFDSNTLTGALRAQADASEEELNRLRGNVKTLTRRVTELEAQVVEKDRALASALQQLSIYNSVVPAMMMNATSAGVNNLTVGVENDNDDVPLVKAEDKSNVQSMSDSVCHVDSVNSFAESECSDGSSIVLVSGLTSSVPATTKAVPVASKILSLDESDDDDGGWT